MDIYEKPVAWIVALCLVCCSAMGIAQEPPRDARALDEPPALPAASTARAGEIRYVAVAEARVYAGPGEDYYPTSQLKLGESVEVYQRTDDGWLAIRPPKGSFSWLPAAQGLLLPGGRVVEVTDQGAVSWIGTALGTAKQYRWQVRLSRGEQLAVLGERTLQDEQSDQKTLWYKIAPPNGEYRWIEEHDTTLQTPMLAAGDEPATAGAPDSDQAAGPEGKTFQSVLTASFEGEDSSQQRPAQAIRAAGQAGARPSRNSSGPRANTAATADPWRTWHAIEYNNGSFSFPGIARMFGIEPAPPASDGNYDPFDLSQGMPRPKSQSPGPLADGAAGSAMDAAAAATDTVTGDPEHAIAAAGSQARAGYRRFHGWRDPRELRELRESGRDGEPASASVANNTISGGPVAAAAASDDAVGTGVVQAGATGPAKASGPASGTGAEDDPSWYGIQQAPAGGAAGYQPLSVSQADLGEIQLRLSEMVSQPQATWNLAPLAQRARYLVDNGATALERGEARLLADRIEAFADLARRSTELGINPITPAAGSLVSGPAPAAPSVAVAPAQWPHTLGVGGQAVEPTSGSAPRFDATGWVVPVHGSSRDAPTHALTNDAGKIIVYLSPAAGVNLARYQGQAVGVYGLRGYLPQLKSNHIQVQRAVRLH
ncbi:MAG: hypothetical protein ACTHOU_08945 [Aureliella sp.]